MLKADGIGAYSYTYSLVSYFIMFAALGTVNYGNREISYLQEDRAKRTKTFWEIELLSVISVIVCLCAYMVFTLAFGHSPLKKHPREVRRCDKRCDQCEYLVAHIIYVV